jgi:anti-sigma regulatory factor (Ser/Thr protein kinase)
MVAATVQHPRRPGSFWSMERTKPQDLEQTYPAVAESICAGRRALTRFAAQAGASAERIEAVRLAASEALTNAVKHAYPSGAGTIHITAAVACGELCVLIADDGCGIRPHASRGGLGLGLTLMASVCDELQIVKRSSGGTGLWLWFKLETEAPVLDDHPRGSVASATAPARSGTFVSTCSERTGDLARQARQIVRRVMSQLDELGALPEDEQQLTLITVGVLDAVVAGARLGHSEAMAQMIEQLGVLAPHVQVEATFRSDIGAQGLLEELRKP